MAFSVWIRKKTGLTLYDFRVLDWDGTSEGVVRHLFYQWMGETKPVTAVISKAIEEAADEGFNVCAA